jgi:hypothetical protein
MKLSNFNHQVKAIIKNILFSFLEPINEKVVILENYDLINAVNKITITITNNSYIFGLVDFLFDVVFDDLIEKRFVI